MKILAFFILTATSFAQAFDVDFSRSSSGSSTSSSIKASHRINEQHKLALTYTLSRDTSGTVSDANASSLKGGYRFKATDRLTLSIDVKRFDDYYFYDGFNTSGKASYKVFKMDQDNGDALETTLNFKLEISQKNYSQLSSEIILGRTLSYGVVQDLPWGFTVGIDLSTSAYDSTGTYSRRALNNQTTAISDINSYTSFFAASSSTIYGEFSYDPFSVGYSQTKDSPLLSSGSSYTSTELFLDYKLSQNLAFFVSTTQGRSGASNTISRTTSFGFSAGF